MMLFIHRVNRLLFKAIYGYKRVAYSKSLNQPMKLHLRCLCSIQTQKDAAIETEKIHLQEEWTKIYFFPKIRVAALLNRLKIYQSVFVVSAFPFILGSYFNNTVDWTTCMIATGGATFTTITLYISTLFFSRLIGAIYIDKYGKNLKIAHLTFWGKRKDILVPVDEVIPLTENNYNDKDVFLKLYKMNSKEYFYITLRFGKILEKDFFETIFGSFEIFSNKK